MVSERADPVSRRVDPGAAVKEERRCAWPAPGSGGGGMQGDGSKPNKGWIRALFLSFLFF